MKQQNGKKETGIESILEPINITAPDFKEKLEIKGSSKAKASHVEYAIRQIINEKIATDPAFYGSLKERMEEIIEEDAKEFSLFGLLLPFRKSIFSNSEEDHVAVTKKIVESIKERRVIDWTEKEDIQREMRKEVKKVLRTKGFQEESLESLTREILNLARIHFKDY